MLAKAMKIAVLLRGVTLKNSHVTSGGLGQSVDWKWTRENIQANVVNAFPGADVYLASYQSVEMQQIVDYFGACAYVFNTLQSDGQTELDCLLGGLRLIARSGQAYDAVLVSRFDLHYYQSLSTLEFDPAGINFLYREFSEVVFKVQGKAANAAWLVPFALLDQFVAAGEWLRQLRIADFDRLEVMDDGVPITCNPAQRTHYFCHALQQLGMSQALHFVREGYFLSSGSRLLCPYYKIIRSNADVPDFSDAMLAKFGQFLFEIARTLDVPEATLAHAAGLGEAVVQRIFEGEHDISMIELQAISSAFTIPLPMLLQSFSEVSQKDWRMVTV